MGTMQDIRDLLAGGGITVAEVIEVGYAPSSVYKAAKQLEGNEQAKEGRPARATMAQENGRRNALESPVANNDEREELERDIARHRQQAEVLRAELEESKCQEGRLAQAAQQVPALQARVASLEAEAREAGRLRQRVADLEGQLRQATTSQALMSQNIDGWRAKALVEGGARQNAEARTLAVGQENKQLHSELEQWRQWGANAQSAVQSLTAEVEELRPLKVWIGHPCRVCKRPLPGVVSREDAAKLMENFGHTACLEKEGPGLLPWLLAGGVALTALSQMQKRS